jgi:hypothetical protein
VVDTENMLEWHDAPFESKASRRRVQPNRPGRATGVPKRFRQIALRRTHSVSQMKLSTEGKKMQKNDRLILFSG